MPTFWVGVASREHVLRAVKGGFCQLSHGKQTPVRRLHQGDVIIFYSPRERMGDAAPLQAFTALGEVIDEAAFPAKQTEDFHPYRRKVRYYDTETAEIRPLLFSLSFTRDRDHWGSSFRRGSFKISRDDFAAIAKAMGLRAKGSNYLAETTIFRTFCVSLIVDARLQRP